MHGNVWEWVADAYLSYSSGARTDPFDAGATDSNRIRRGGSWYNGVGLMPLARRVYNSPSYRTDHIGFRLAYRQITTPPGNLVSTAPLTIAENPPIGTVVGEFNATDPDAGATLTYYLVSGAGTPTIRSSRSKPTAPSRPQPPSISKPMPRLMPSG